MCLRTRSGWIGQREVGDLLADSDHPFKKRTILDALADLVTQGYAERLGVAAGEAGAWRAGADAPPSVRGRRLGDALLCSQAS